jgi:transcriptional regulator with XRE-family HTH domain
VKTTHLGPYQHFLERLTALREERRCTQAELGRRLGKPQSYVSKVESGERKLDLVEYVYWCKVLDKDPTTLVAELADSVGRVLPGGVRRAVIARRTPVRR